MLVLSYPGQSWPIHFRQDLLCRLGPHQRFRRGITLGHIRVNGRNQLGDAAEYAATNLFSHQVAKDAFHQIEPRTTRRGEVHVDARVAREPSLNRGVFVRGVVVGDQMQGLALGNVVINQTQEPQPFLMPMPRQAGGEDGASATLRAAKSVVVPWCLWSCVIVPHRPFLVGKPAGCDPALGSGLSHPR